MDGVDRILVVILFALLIFSTAVLLGITEEQGEKIQKLEERVAALEVER